MRSKLKTGFALMSIALFGCTTTKFAVAPCYDGWTTEETSSHIVSPSADLLAFLRVDAGIGPSAIQCVHELPAQRKFIVLVREKSGGINALSVKKGDAGFEMIEKEFVL